MERCGKMREVLMEKKIISSILAVFAFVFLLANNLSADATDTRERVRNAVVNDEASPWAKEAGLTAAMDIGLIPESISTMGWENNATRLAAAEAVVKLVETVLDMSMEEIALECGWDLNANQFSDTSSESVTFLKYARVIDGVGGNSFVPDGEFNRAQIATMMGRCAERLFGIKMSGDNPYIDDVPDWAAPYVAYIAEIGVTKGVSDSAFNPYGTLQNQEMAILSWRAFNAWLNLSLELKVSTAYVYRQSTPMDDSFFEDSAIVGNSLIDGLRLFSGLKTCEYFCATSMTVVSATNNVIDRLKGKEYQKVYILLGINEIGYDSYYFKDLYAKMVDKVKDIQPTADIYIMGLTPVSRSKSDSSTSFNMTRVKAYNERLLELAQEKSCYFIDLCDALEGDDGYLPANSTWDGVHLNSDYYKVWFEYLKYHYIP